MRPTRRGRQRPQLACQLRGSRHASRSRASSSAFGRNECKRYLVHRDPDDSRDQNLLFARAYLNVRHNRLHRGWREWPSLGSPSSASASHCWDRSGHRHRPYLRHDLAFALGGTSSWFVIGEIRLHGHSSVCDGGFDCLLDAEAARSRIWWMALLSTKDHDCQCYRISSRLSDVP